MKKVTVRLQDTVDAALVEGLEALAKAQGRKRAELLEDAIRILLSPLPALMRAAEVVDQAQQRQRAVEDQIRVVADFVVDATRSREGEM